MRTLHPSTHYLVGPRKDEYRSPDFALLIGYALDHDERDDTEDRRRADDNPTAPKKPRTDYPVQLAIALEVVGTKSAVDALRRDLRRGEWLTISGPNDQHDRVRARSAASTHAAALSTLPDGLVHGLLLHPAATLPGITSDEPFYLVEPDAIPGVDGTASQDAARFASHFLAALDNAIAAPLLGHWARVLWCAGCDRGLITRLPRRWGLDAWRIETANPDWGRLISQLVKHGQLREVDAVAPTPTHEHQKELWRS